MPSCHHVPPWVPITPCMQPCATPMHPCTHPMWSHAQHMHMPCTNATCPHSPPLPMAPWWLMLPVLHPRWKRRCVRKLRHGLTAQQQPPHLPVRVRAHLRVPHSASGSLNTPSCTFVHLWVGNHDIGQHSRSAQHTSSGGEAPDCTCGVVL